MHRTQIVLDIKEYSSGSKNKYLGVSNNLSKLLVTNDNFQFYQPSTRFAKRRKINDE
jgi:hypothetical protein